MPRRNGGGPLRIEPAAGPGNQGSQPAQPTGAKGMAEHPEKDEPHGHGQGEGELARQGREAHRLLLMIGQLEIGEVATDEELGGARMHSFTSGLSDYFAVDEIDAIRAA